MFLLLSYDVRVFVFVFVVVRTHGLLLVPLCTYVLGKKVEEECEEQKNHELYYLYGVVCTVQYVGQTTVSTRPLSTVSSTT